MRSLGRWQSRDERGQRLLGDPNCWMTPGLSLLGQPLSVLLWKSKVRLASSTQHGKRKILVILGVEQTPESGMLLESCPEHLAAILHVLAGHLYMPPWLV